MSRRTIVVTGAGGALGSALSTHFALQPDTDLVVSDVSQKSLDETYAAIVAAESDRGSGSETSVHAQLADVSNFEQMEQVATTAMERFGRIDGFINNAGVLSPNGRIHNLSTEHWERSFQINVMGSVNAIRAAVPIMRAQQSGSIVCTASVSGVTAWSHAGPYCATKAAVIQLAKVAAVEYARDGIRVNSVCPGSFKSAIHAELPDSAIESIAAKHPLGLGEPQDLVSAYDYLVSDAARWVTGTSMIVDGGYSAP